MVRDVDQMELESFYSGEVAFLRFRVSGAEDPEFDDRLLSFARESRRELETEIAHSVAEVLGGDYELLRLGIRKGSIEILVVVGAIYVTVSQYKDFVESFNLLASHLRSVIGRFFQRTQTPGLRVTAAWSPSADVLRARKERIIQRSDRVADLVVWYLVFSHAAMFALLSWIVIKWALNR